MSCRMFVEEQGGREVKHKNNSKDALAWPSAFAVYGIPVPP